MERPKRDICSAFGSALRAARRARGLSQEALAFECDLHRTYVSSVERGERNISIINIERLCIALGILPSSLLESAGF
jgi:transcriptional regulator with XRE-family HTH domain